MRYTRLERLGAVGFPVVLPALLLLSPVAPAQTTGQPDETLPGFKPNQTYSSSSVDHINLFNGDPGIVIPLGPEYPLSAGLTWQLRAFYSAKLWQFEDGPCGAEDSASFATALGASTLGLGWTLDLGYVGCPLGDTGGVGCYRSPDGARHIFYSQTGSLPGQTADGTDLQLTQMSGGGFAVAFPDGTVHELTHPFTWPRPSSGQSPDLLEDSYFTRLTPATKWGLSAIRDRTDRRVLAVEYAGTGADSFKISRIVPNPEAMPPGRAISFTWGSLGITCGATPTWPVLQSIAFPASSGQTLTVTFGFVSASSSCLPRNPFDNSSKCGISTPPTADVPFLGQISIGDQVYSFSFDAGTLSSFALPTGGTTSYVYDRTTTNCNVGAPNCVDPETDSYTPLAAVNEPNPGQARDALQQFLDNSPAVISRTLWDPVTSQSSTTSYSSQQYLVHYPAAPDYVDQTRVARVKIVTAPSGNGTSRATRYVFHVSYEPRPSGSGVELSRRLYDDTQIDLQPIRSIVSCYDSDATATVCGYWSASGDVNAFNLQNNVRREGTVTWFGPSQAGGGVCSSGTSTATACWEQRWFGWDQVAHEYGVETVSAPSTGPSGILFPAGSGPLSRQTTTVWAPSVSPRWLPKLYSSRTVQDAYASGGCPATGFPCTLTTNTVFSTADGTLTSSSVGDGTASLTRSFSYTAGDPTDELLAASGSGLAPATYETSRTFSTGLVASTRRIQPAGIVWSSFEVIRDPTTGLILGSFDPNRLETVYTYDALGRLTLITPPGSAETPTVISYDTPTQTTVSRSGGPGKTTWSRYLYDGFGRLIRELRLMPGSTYAVRTTAYNDAGLKSFESEWAACTNAGGDCLSASPPGTTWSSFDLFGRAQVVQRADGTSTTIDRTDGTIVFSDTREAVTANVSGSPATTVTRKDVLGRVVSVTEPDVGAGPDVTTYSYNGLDKLTGVTQGSQTRSFAYDLLGFLRSETHPEKGTTTYSLYDGLGNVLSRTDGETSYAYTYDPVGRLLTASGGGTTYESNCYDDPATCGNAGGGQYPKGRLIRRIGYNPGVDSSLAAAVTETFSYDDRLGRLSGKTTQFSLGPLSGALLGEKWLYNSLGLVAGYQHPRFSGLFVETTVYDAGLPVKVLANGIPVVKNVSYAPYGGLASYTTGSGAWVDTTTTIGADPHGMARPAEFLVRLGSSSFWGSGGYTYDGAGNVTSAGGSSGDSFAYDARSRLTSARLLLPGGVYPTQSYDYDRWGNLTLGPSGSNAIDSATNRYVAGSSFAYDSRGNLTRKGTETYAFDAFDRQVSHNAPAVTWSYLYDGTGERVAKVAPNTPATWYYTLRDDSKRIVTEFEGSIPSRDNIYLGNLLVASYGLPSRGPEIQYFASDHLGSPRVTTNTIGAALDSPKYWPFGGAAVPPSPTAQRHGFAAMERETEEQASRYHDHARSHDFNLGRFIGVDKLGGRVEDPQSWNRYAYARNNPLKFVDPDGKEVRFADSFIARLKTDSQFKHAYQMWKATPSGGAQFRSMVDDANSVYTFSVGRILAMVGPLEVREANGLTTPEGRAVATFKDQNKSGKLDLPAIESKINADHVESDFSFDPRRASKEMAKTLFEESAHALDQGSNTKSFGEAWKVEALFNTNTEPRMQKFELELLNLNLVAK